MIHKYEMTRCINRFRYSRKWYVYFVLSWLIYGTTISIPTLADQATGQRSIVASVQPIATGAGQRAFQQGGNAIDAAIATALTLGIVDGHNSGLGGGCLILVRLHDGTVHAIDGRETAPAAACRDMFLRDGKAVAVLSRDGALAVGVPGALAAYRQCAKLGAKLPFESHLRNAAQIAEDGFVVDSNFRKNINENKSLIERFPEAARVLLKADGTNYSEGEVLRMPDLAQSYRHIADDENWFYRGAYAEQVVSWMKANGGLLTIEDFHQYQSIEREPVRSTYRGYEILGVPPPTSGGILVALILNILENFDLANLFEQRPAEAYHVIAEAMKLAFADRAKWLGDADFTPVPRGLLSKDYARELANRIQRDRVAPVPSHSQPPDWQTNIFPKHTTHITAADAQGNWVAITATINTSFGSKVIVPGTGIVLNNTLDDFSAQPGVPNVFGLVGGDANAVESRKRALSSMSPTIVMKDGQPLFSVGAAGGPKIITQVVMAIIHQLDAKLSLPETIERPRLHHQWLPDKLVMEKNFDGAIRTELSRMGHSIEEIGNVAIVQGIGRHTGGILIGVSDPRVPGKAAGL
jgi:gamma-glutamyltranspeptidase/glutathione hydrolase